MKCRRMDNRGQVTLEQGILYVAVCTALVFCAGMIQRAVQGSMSDNSKGIGRQFSLNSGYSEYSESNSVSDGDGQTSGSCNTYVHELAEEGASGAPAIKECTAPDAP